MIVEQHKYIICNTFIEILPYLNERSGGDNFLNCLRGDNFLNPGLNNPQYKKGCS